MEYDRGTGDHDGDVADVLRHHPELYAPWRIGVWARRVLGYDGYAAARAGYRDRIAVGSAERGRLADAGRIVVGVGFALGSTVRIRFAIAAAVGFGIVQPVRLTNTDADADADCNGNRIADCSTHADRHADGKPVAVTDADGDTDARPDVGRVDRELDGP